MKKVAVLLSSYNGEQYIEEQLTSIVNQSYENIEIYIRDDCSTDQTVQVIRKFLKYKNVHFIQGEKNLGYPEGFYNLMGMDINADYFSFSDQDDVWEKDKIKNAVELMSGSSENVPVLYFAAYDICDDQLNYISTQPNINFKPEFCNSLFQCLALGYTIVLNKKAKIMSYERRSKETISKDVWIGMLCAGLGEVIFDSRSCAKYRRNDGAFSVSSTNFIEIQKNRFQKLFKNNGFASINSLMTEFLDNFSDELPDEKRSELELFAKKKQRLRKVFYSKRLRYNFSDEIFLRLMFLIGKV